MANSAVLNPWLYERLQRLFGSVAIASNGVGMRGRHTADIHHSRGTKFQMAIAGEYYRVNCPFCVKKCGRADTRKRLWIHHRYGVGPKNQVGRGDRFYWAAHCFNEECLTHPATQKELRTMIFKDIGRAARGKIVVMPGISDDGALVETTFPGTCVSLDALPIDHHANVYLRSRKLDPVMLAQQYKVRWCQQAPPECAQAYNRIIFPIYMHGQMTGWQGRYIGDLDWKAARVPKYYTQPGCHLRNMLYGFDAARGQPFVIVVEGVTDVIALGAGAVATFGKKTSLSATHYDLLVNNWPVIVLLLDADAYEASELLYEQMRLAKPVVYVRLEDGLDPATAVMQDANALWNTIDWTARNQGVTLGNE